MFTIARNLVEAQAEVKRGYLINTFRTALWNYQMTIKVSSNANNVEYTIFRVRKTWFGFGPTVIEEVK